MANGVHEVQITQVMDHWEVRINGEFFCSTDSYVEAINIAVEWWANKLIMKHPHSNGDNALPSILACLLADDGMEDTTDKQIDIFKAELRSKIESNIGNRYGQVYLGCDYHPSPSLRESAEVAGINVLNFLFKTDLYIKWDGDEYNVYVYDGYGSPREELDV